eukprot:4698493-Prymnesium_polylepis.1
MKQCQVVMHITDGGLAFQCDDAARQCIEARRIELTRYALHPRSNTGFDAHWRNVKPREEDWTPTEWSEVLRTSVKEFIRRVRAYEKYGFRLGGWGDWMREGTW